MRRFVIGDIHGCAQALATLVREISPTADDMLVFLGDYVDRGPDSRAVVDQLIELGDRCQVISLRGNHEVMFLAVLFGGLEPELWLGCGGQATVASYGGSLDRIPQSHLRFLQSLRPDFETSEEAFIHAGYDPQCPIAQTADNLRYWEHPVVWPGPHRSGKRVYVGHSPQTNGECLDLGHLVCVDTYCFGGGWLTALDLDSHRPIQASQQGKLRQPPLASAWRWAKRAVTRRPYSDGAHQPPPADGAIPPPGQPG